jgi:hypothetical protein
MRTEHCTVLQKKKYNEEELLEVLRCYAAKPVGYLPLLNFRRGKHTELGLRKTQGRGK